MNTNKLVLKDNYKSYALRVLPYVFFTIAIFLVLVQMPLMGDDKYSLELIKQYGGITNTLSDYYNTWGGRLPQTILWLAFSRLPMKLWAAVMSLCFTGFMYLLFHSGSFDTAKLGANKSFAIKTSAFSFVFLISFTTLLEGFFWFTGSFYYFLSVLAMFIAFIPIRRVWFGESDKLSGYLICLLPALYASFFEQTGLVLIGMGISAIIVSIVTKKLSKFSIGYTVLIAAAFIVGITSPGNHVRNINEALKWFPDYNMLSVSDKLFAGLCQTLNHCFNNSALLFAIISIFVLLIMNEKFKNKCVTLISAIPLVFITVLNFPFDTFPLSKVINKNIVTEISGYLNNFTKFNPSNKYNPKFYIGVILGLSVLLLLGFLIYSCFENKKKGIFNALLLAAAFLSGIAAGFSATVYISGSRIFFVSDILFVLVAVNMTAEAFCNLKKRKIAVGVSIAAILFAMLNLLTYISQITSMCAN